MNDVFFLIVLGVIGLAGIGGSIYAVKTDGYGPVRTRDSAHLAAEFTSSVQVTAGAAATETSRAEAGESRA